MITFTNPVTRDGLLVLDAHALCALGAAIAAAQAFAEAPTQHQSVPDDEQQDQPEGSANLSPHARLAYVDAVLRTALDAYDDPAPVEHLARSVVRRMGETLNRRNHALEALRDKLADTEKQYKIVNDKLMAVNATTNMNMREGLEKLLRLAEEVDVVPSTSWGDRLLFLRGVWGKYPLQGDRS